MVVLQRLLLVALLTLPPLGGSAQQGDYGAEKGVVRPELPPAQLCGVPASQKMVLRNSSRCAEGEEPVNLVLCRESKRGVLNARAVRCSDGEERLSRGLAAALTTLLPPRPVVVIDDLTGSGPGVPVPPVQAINKCGKAACLCTGTFCADLIDANYCEDFHCGGPQCICIF